MRPKTITDSLTRQRQRKRRSDAIEIDANKLVQVENLARLGFTRRKIAAVFGYSDEWWRKKCLENPNLELAYQKGRVSGIKDVSEAALNMAKAGNNWNATIGWLERRDPETWGLKQRLEITNKHDFKGADGSPLKGLALIEEMQKRLEMTKQKLLAEQALALPEAPNAS